MTDALRVNLPLILTNDDEDTADPRLIDELTDADSLSSNVDKFPSLFNRDDAIPSGLSFAEPELTPGGSELALDMSGVESPSDSERYFLFKTRILSFC